MNITITPTKLKGTITPPPSKSQAHRLILAAALAGGESVLSNMAMSQDIQATRRCLAALGALVEELEPGTLRVHGLGNSIPQAGPFPVLDCGESGSTLRFLIPVALLVQGEAAFTGRSRLMERPLAPYKELFRGKGISWSTEGGVLTLDSGRGYDRLALDPGEYRLPGNVSSQFITGLLFVLPLLEGDSDLALASPLESRGYVELTLDVLNRFGIQIEERENGFHVPGKQSYQSRDFTVEADWSQAAFWYAANFSGGQVDIQGLNMNSKQGDKGIALQYWKLDKPGDAELDVSQCPDLVPPLAAMAAVRAGTTRLTNAARLRMKESDRLASVTRALRAMGGAGGGARRRPDHPRGRAAAGGRHCGLRQRPPHRHDGSGLRRLCGGSGKTAGGGVRQKILSGILDPFSIVRRRSPWPHTSVITSISPSSASPTRRPSG